MNNLKQKIHSLPKAIRTVINSVLTIVYSETVILLIEFGMKQNQLMSWQEFIAVGMIVFPVYNWFRGLLK